MKQSCLIGVIIAISAAASASASATGFFQQGSRTAIATKDRDAPTSAPSKSEDDSLIPISIPIPIVPAWPERSRIPVIAQYIWATVWICMIAALPFIMPMIDSKPVTTTQKFVGAALLVVLFGGLYLFTNVILFESVHFKTVRPLTTIECIYFMSQVITTVGYGDIYPAKPRGQVFVALYVLGALFVIAMLVSQAIDHCTEVLHKHRERIFQTPRTQSGNQKRTTVHELLHPERPSIFSLLMSLVCFLVIDLVWVVFFSTFPGENKTVFEAFYMSLITLTTVGLGAITPITEEGMIFGAFFMIFGSGAVVNVISKFCEIVAQFNEFQRFGADVKKAAIDDLKNIQKSPGQVTELEFFRFVIGYAGVMTEGEVDGILQVFEGLNPKNGMVDFKTVEQSMELERSRSQYFEGGIL